MSLSIAVVLFPRLTALDAIGPYEILQRLPDAEVTFVGHERGHVRTENGFLGLVVDSSFDDLPRPDVVVVPGGVGTRSLVHDPVLGEWLRAAHETSRLTTSVCTGSLLLAGAGLLKGLTATTHWAAYDELRALGAEPTSQRVVEHLDHRIVTAAGVSAGIDMALRLAALLVDDVAAQAMQLFTEYDPQPPFDSGSPATASAEVLARAQLYARTKR
jgi:putative intracellular protease/amidase